MPGESDLTRTNDCRGLQPSELFSAAFQVGVDPTGSVDAEEAEGHRLRIASAQPTIHSESRPSLVARC